MKARVIIYPGNEVRVELNDPMDDEDVKALSHLDDLRREDVHLQGYVVGTIYNPDKAQCIEATIVLNPK